MLNKRNIDVTNYREQSYDNASNMSGTYKRMRPELKNIAGMQIIAHVLPTR